MSRYLHAVHLGLATALVGCGSDIGVDPVDDTGPPVALVPVQETFVQRPLPAVDLLLVVDDTASMGQEQEALSEEFPKLASALEAAGVSWQLGVVTTDMSGPQAGWLRGSPYVLTAGVAHLVDDAIRVGTGGAAPEAGMAAAAAALDLATPDGPNAGFRRPDAALHVVFFSDADDASDAWLGDDPPRALVARLAAEPGPAPAVVSAVVGDPEGGCVSDKGTAQAGVRYAEAARATSGAQVSICSADLAKVIGALGDASIVWPARFRLARPPVEGTLRVRVDGRATDAWWFDAPSVELVFERPPPASARVDVEYVVEHR